MGKDSEYYKNKKRSQLTKLNELLDELPDFAREYLYDKEQNLQPSSMISYSYDLLTFFRFLKARNPYFKNKNIKDFRISDMELLVSEDINEFQRYLAFSDTSDEANGIKESHENDRKAIARKMAPLRGMFQYNAEHEYIKKNPMTLVKLPKIKKDKNIVRMNTDEVNILINAVANQDANMSAHQRAISLKNRDRDLAIITLMLNTGIRVSECAGLDIADVDFKACTITIVRKGGGQDILYFGDDVKEALSVYVEGKRKCSTPLAGHESALFLSSQNKRMSVDAIENLVKKYTKAVIPNKKITPHKLRSTFGTALYRETGDIRLVADVLGHENMNTTVSAYAAIEDEHKKVAGHTTLYKSKE